MADEECADFDYESCPYFQAMKKALLDYAKQRRQEDDEAMYLGEYED